MIRRVSFAFIFTVITVSMAFGQRHEVGVQLGASNLVGDIGKTSYINPFPGSGDNITYEGIPFYGSIMYRMNFNPYQTVRINAAYNHILFNDKYAKETYRRNRKLWGTNDLFEMSALFEYNMFPVNEEQRSMVSPYIFGGVSGLLGSVMQVTLAHDFNRNAAGTAIAPTSNEDFVTTATYSSARKIAMAIPFGIGLKYKFNYNWALFGEFMFRATFSDGIDYSNISDKDMRQTYNKDILAPDSNKSLLQSGEYEVEANRRAEHYLEQRNVGNPNSKDWVNTLSIGLSYSFGRPPCYCDPK